MTATLTNETPQTIDRSIVNRAMLVDLNISIWSASKHDKRASMEVAEKHGSDSRLGRFNKTLLEGPEFDAVRKVATKARNTFDYYTLPWVSRGPSILGSDGFLPLMSKMREHKHEWEKATDALFEAYPRLIEEARVKLNGLFREEEYPSLEDVKKKFRFSVNVFPVPMAEDFRVQLGDDDLIAIKKSMEEEHNERLGEAMKEVWQRLMEQVSHLKTRLEIYDPTLNEEITDPVTGKTRVKTKANPFRDSLVKNLINLVDVLPGLNITNDPNITKATNQIRQDLCFYNADVLRVSEDARAEVCEKAQEILDFMKDFV